MKKTIKVLCGLMTAASIILSATVPTNAEGIDYKNYKGLVYTTNNAKAGYVRIADYKGNKKSITVPQKIKGKKVQMISSLKKAKKLKAIHISKGISLAKLSDAPVLKKVTVAKSNKALSAKNNLLLNKKGTIVKSCPGGIAEVTVPGSVKTIGHQSFTGSKVKKVTMGNKVTGIESYAFSKCTNLTNIKLSQSLKKVESFAFENCESLEEVSVPKNVKKIQEYTFSNCKNLKKVTFEGTKLSSIYNEAFSYCENLKEVYMLNLEKAPVIPKELYIENKPFSNTKQGIRFYVKNEKVAGELAEQLKGSGVKDADIYAGSILVYTKVN